jgi:hypothetical protein
MRWIQLSISFDTKGMLQMLTCVQDLETMWRNTSTQMKPGGKLVNTRVTGHLDESYAASGKYGISISDLKPFPGGMQYQVHCHIDPPFHFGASQRAGGSGVPEGRRDRDGKGRRSFLGRLYQSAVHGRVDGEEAVSKVSTQLLGYRS